MLSGLLPFFFVGPTAVGKSALAIEFAERCGGEIVGADAFQIYRGLDVLTAKPDPVALARVPHHLIGELPLTENLDAAKYAALAEARIAEIQARGRRPIVVGGTGFYIRALTHGLPELPAGDQELRAKLEGQPLAELVRRLEQLDPEAGARIDRNNPRRVIRALEVCLLTGQPFSSFRKDRAEPRFPLHGVALVAPSADLYARIERRTEAMWKAGVVDEVRAIGAISATAEKAIGFQEIRAFLTGRLDERECIRKIQQATRNYAKRQGTWFRLERAFVPFDLSEHSDPVSALIDRLQRTDR